MFDMRKGKLDGKYFMQIFKFFLSIPRDSAGATKHAVPVEFTVFIVKPREKLDGGRKLIRACVSGERTESAIIRRMSHNSSATSSSAIILALKRRRRNVSPQQQQQQQQ